MTRLKRGSACIYVLAGTNGAGKSSIGGAVIRALGADYFNPLTRWRRAIQAARPHLSDRDANIAAWQEGKRLLETAIARRWASFFETTLGGNTMTALLQQALAEGVEVRARERVNPPVPDGTFSAGSCPCVAKACATTYRRTRLGSEGPSTVVSIWFACCRT